MRREGLREYKAEAPLGAVRVFHAATACSPAVSKGVDDVGVVSLVDRPRNASHSRTESGVEYFGGMSSVDSPSPMNGFEPSRTYRGVDVLSASLVFV